MQIFFDFATDFISDFTTVTLNFNKITLIIGKHLKILTNKISSAQ